MLRDVTAANERTVLILLPGMDGTNVLYGPLVRALPDWLRPVCVEYPTDGPCDYDAAFAAAMAEVERHERCHVVGWSFSGPVALRVARAMPDRVRSVTLVATFVTAPLASMKVFGPLLVTPLVALVRTLRRLPIWLGRSPDDPLRRDKAEIWRRVRPHTLAARTRAIRRVDAREDLRAITQPMLYLRSSDDRVVPAHNLAQIRALRGDVAEATIDGDHFALYAEAQAGANAIAAFVRRAEAAAAT